jgi:hypothetical protein
MSVLRIANASAFYGDRSSAPLEMVRGGAIDVLTGDYLAELTMAILLRQRTRDPKLGYVPTFLAQMEEVLGECLARGIRVVSNAGGLAPDVLADALAAMAAKLGLAPRIAVVTGDDLLPRLDAILAAGETFAHLDDGRPLAALRSRVLTANAYLGSWGIRDALTRGADIVVTGRVTDAALVVGPAAWRFGWAKDDWDALAGAVAAGHVIECGTQATGGNYAFFEEVPSFTAMGFPLVEMSADGSFVVTKHPGTGGIVSVGTVTAQLVYEIDSPRYATPDVVARFDSLELVQEAPDRVLVRGARGEPPPDTAKVCVLTAGGFRNAMTLHLAAPNVEKKAALVESMLFESLGGRDAFARTDVKLLRTDRESPRTNEEALATMRITVMDPDAAKVGRAFSSRVVELATSSVPGIGLTTPPGDATPYVVLWPALVSASVIEERVHFEGESFPVQPPPAGTPLRERPAIASVAASAKADDASLVRARFGDVFGTRSGDKGGHANLGVWARDDRAFAWLDGAFDVAALKALLPDLAAFEIDRHRLPNLRALNFVVRGLLGEGVSSSTRIDPQAKTLGEYLRAQAVELPASLGFSQGVPQGPDVLTLPTLAVRPYHERIRERVFLALQRAGCAISLSDVIRAGTSDDEAVTRVLASSHRVLLVPFHAHKDAQGRPVDGVQFVTKLAARAKAWRWRVLMPVSPYAAPAVSMAMSAAAPGSPLARGEVLFMPEAELDDPELPAKIRKHVG